MKAALGLREDLAIVIFVIESASPNATIFSRENPFFQRGKSEKAG
jgi:hypothetical protein